MKLEVGMYVRTKDRIVRIEKILDGVMWDTQGHLHFGDFIKASHSIIDLIKVGDYVNGYKITNICNTPRKHLVTEYRHNINYVHFYIYEENIKTIVTKEQFESMAYKVSE